MTTDITELALLVSKAKASVFTLEYISQFESADIDSDDVDLRFEVDGRDTGTNVSIVDECGQAAKVISELVEALEKAQAQIIALQQKAEIDPRTHEIIDLKERIIETNDVLCSLLPDCRYMDQPDGGSVTPLEQVSRMISDYRQRIAELESRTVKLPRWLVKDAIAVYDRDEIEDALTAAGIKVEAE